jgi:hypothetical protein
MYISILPVDHLKKKNYLKNKLPVKHYLNFNNLPLP